MDTVLHKNPDGQYIKNFIFLLIQYIMLLAMLQVNPKLGVGASVSFLLQFLCIQCPVQTQYGLNGYFTRRLSDHFVAGSSIKQYNDKPALCVQLEHTDFETPELENATFYAKANLIWVVILGPEELLFTNRSTLAQMRNIELVEEDRPKGFNV